jgi:hypothetical protein
MSTNRPPSFVPSSLLCALSTVLCATLVLGSASAQQARSQPAARIAPAPPQDPKTQTELIVLRKAKLAKPVFENAAWRTDFDAARKAAKASGKLLLAYFTRSYAH